MILPPLLEHLAREVTHLWLLRCARSSDVQNVRLLYKEE